MLSEIGVNVVRVNVVAGVIAAPVTSANVLAVTNALVTNVNALAKTNVIAQNVIVVISANALTNANVLVATRQNATANLKNANAKKVAL